MKVNQMIVALFNSNKLSMKYSENSARLSIAKLTFSLAIWIWLNLLCKILAQYAHAFNQVYSNNFFGWILFFISFVIVNYCTWNLSEVEAFSDDANNIDELAKARWQFLSMLIIGFTALMCISLYYYK